jgi:hypothetical protein
MTIEEGKQRAKTKESKNRKKKDPLFYTLLKLK